MRKFAVGDRVAVYGLGKNLQPVRIVATVTKAATEDENYLYLNQEESFSKDFDLTMVHPKQCRLLKPAKKRSVFLLAFDLETLALPGNRARTCTVSNYPVMKDDVELVVRRKK